MNDLIRLYEDHAREYRLSIKIAVAPSNHINMHVFADEQAGYRYQGRYQGDMEIAFACGDDIEECAKTCAEKLRNWIVQEKRC